MSMLHHIPHVQGPGDNMGGDRVKVHVVTDGTGLVLGAFMKDERAFAVEEWLSLHGYTPGLVTAVEVDALPEGCTEEDLG